VKTNVFFNFVNSRATHSFMRMNVIEWLRWATTKVVKTHQSAIGTKSNEANTRGDVYRHKECGGPSSRQTSQCVSWKFLKPSLTTPFGHLLCWYFERRWVLIESHN
jgi:hypothetical protein